MYGVFVVGGCGDDRDRASVRWNLGCKDGRGGPGDGLGLRMIVRGVEKPGAAWLDELTSHDNVMVCGSTNTCEELPRAGGRQLSR